MKRLTLILGGLLILAAASTAHAGWSVGVRIGGPVYHRPWYPGPWCAPYPYYRPYPVVIAPPPIFVAPAPVVAVQPAVVAAAPSETPEPVAAPRLQPIARAASTSNESALSDPSEQTRADAIIERGRNKDRQAVAPITKALREDPSPTVRESAARALGLIALPGSLKALQHAAQSDPDRDVRRSAAFAADVIRANMPR